MKHILLSIATFLASLAVGFFGTKLLRTGPETDPGSEALLATAPAPDIVAASGNAPVITDVKCTYDGAKYYRIFPTVTNVDKTQVTYKIAQGDGEFTEPDYGENNDGSRFIKHVRPSAKGYRLVAVDNATGKESEIFLVTDCKPIKLTAAELTKALNARSISEVSQKVQTPLKVSVVGEPQSGPITHLNQIVNNLQGGNWKSVDVSSVGYNDYGMVTSFTLTVVKAD